MNKLRELLVKSLALTLGLISLGNAYGQTETKTYSETFNVTDETVLDINTSHADIEFETWDKDQISVQATIKLEGATAEEAERYFEHEEFEIIGNSKKVSVSTGRNSNSFLSSWNHDQNFNFDFEFPELGTNHLWSQMIDFPEIPELPNTPPVPHFDFEAYSKDKEAYLKKWQKQIDKNFGDDYKNRMEEWGKKFETKNKELLKRREEQMKKREDLMEKRNEKLEKARALRLEKRGIDQNSRLKIHIDGKDTLIVRNGRQIFIDSDGDHELPSIFYFSSDGENKKYEVKKTIKVKMPKGMKIKMNVRHGEVKLAANTKNIDATISHSTLWASTIDGDKTTIKASYSPVSVQQWNYGQLQADYSDKVRLKEVLNLRLNATSSDITIDRLVNTAFIKNDFGPLRINSISKNFKDLDISLQNAELECKVPQSAFTIYVNGTSSSFSCPASFTLERTKNYSNTIHRGYHLNERVGGSMVINSTYSEVNLD